MVRIGKRRTCNDNRNVKNSENCFPVSTMADNMYRKLEVQVYLENVSSYQKPKTSVLNFAEILQLFYLQLISVNCGNNYKGNCKLFQRMNNISLLLPDITKLVASTNNEYHRIISVYQ